MARIICKIPYKGEDYYLIYSTISDDFSTQGVTLDRFTEYMREREGSRYMETEHHARMERVEKFGTSSMPEESVEELVDYNRCGPNEECWSMEEIVDKFVAASHHRPPTSRSLSVVEI